MRSDVPGACHNSRQYLASPVRYCGIHGQIRSRSRNAQFSPAVVRLQALYGFWVDSSRRRNRYDEILKRPISQPLSTYRVARFALSGKPNGQLMITPASHSRSVKCSLGKSGVCVRLAEVNIMRGDLRITPDGLEPLVCSRWLYGEIYLLNASD